MNILFLIIGSVILLILLSKKKKVENYQNFKKVVVKVSPHIFNKQNIIISHNDEKLFNFIQSIIPFNYTVLDDQLEILKKIKDNHIGLINDWTVYNFIYKNQIMRDNSLKDRLRYICSIKKQYFYLIVSTPSNIYSVNALKNKKIGMYGKRPDYVLFFEELGYNENNIQFVDYNIRDKKAQDDFRDNKIDAFFFIDDYPNSTLSQFKDYRIIDMTDINIDNPAIGFEKIDFIDYGLIGEYRTVNLCMTKASLYGLNNISSDFVYNFISSIFNNIQKINSISLIKTGGYKPNVSNLYNMGYNEMGKNINKVKFILYLNRDQKKIENLYIGIFDSEKYHMSLIGKNRFIQYRTMDNIQLSEGFILGNNKINFDKLFTKGIDCTDIINKYRKSRLNIETDIPKMIIDKEYMECLLKSDMNTLTDIEIYTRIIHNLENNVINGFFISTVDDSKIDTLFNKYKKVEIPFEKIENNIVIPQIIIPSNILPSEYNITIHNGTKKYLDKIGYITDNPNKKCMHFIGTGKCPLSYNE